MASAGDQGTQNAKRGPPGTLKVSQHARKNWNQSSSCRAVDSFSEHNQALSDYILINQLLLQSIFFFAFVHFPFSNVSIFFFSSTPFSQDKKKKKKNKKRTRSLNIFPVLHVYLRTLPDLFCDFIEPLRKMQQKFAISNIIEISRIFSELICRDPAI